MVVVIGARASKVGEADAHHIFGVTAGNDVTERGFPFHPFDVLRAKGSDSMAPVGPWIVPGLAFDRLKLRTRLNGSVVQETSTADMVHGVARIVSHVSQYITLEPGDVIYTGTPGVTKPMRPGDVVEVELEGVGVLRNTVAKRE
jgi:2-keto-4-pentenoate hydratase/2-oxohepta-3-ene-1,7-dioic acid hydratase in catechol pathway